MLGSSVVPRPFSRPWPKQRTRNSRCSTGATIRGGERRSAALRYPRVSTGLVEKSVDLPAAAAAFTLESIADEYEFVFEVWWHRSQTVQLVLERWRAPVERAVALFEFSTSTQRDDLGNEKIGGRRRHRQPIRHDVSDRIIAWATGCHPSRMPDMG